MPDPNQHDAKKDGISWRNEARFRNRSLVIWRPRILSVGKRTFLAPLPLFRNGTKPKFATPERQQRDAEKGSPGLQQADFGVSFSYRNGTLLPRQSLNNQISKISHAWLPIRIRGIETAFHQFGVSANTKVGQSQEPEIPLRIETRNKRQEDTGTAAQGIIPKKTGAPASELKYNRSTKFGSSSTPRLPTPSLPCGPELDIGTPILPGSGKTRVTKAGQPSNPPKRASLHGPIAPLPPRNSAAVRQGVTAESAQSHGKPNQAKSLSGHGQDVRSGATDGSWSEPVDNGHRPHQNLSGTLYLDGSTLSQWLFARMDQEVNRPCTGITAVDLRTTPPWSVPNIGI